MSDQPQNPVVDDVANNQPQQQPQQSPAPVTTGLFNNQTAEQWFNQYSGSQRALREKDNAYRQALVERDQLTQTKAQIEVERDTIKGDLERQLQDAIKKATDLEVKLSAFEKRAQIRTTISSTHKELVPLYDEGLMPGVEGLEGDNLTTFLDKFKGYLNVQNQQTLETALSGATPSAPTTPTPSGMTKDQMLNWLMDHRPSDKGYAEMKVQFEQADKPKPT